MTSTYDVAAIRSQFPVLGRKMRGKELIYFDNGATSLKPEPVLAAIDEYNREYSVNIHRGVYELSGKATAEYDEARRHLRALIGASADTGEVIFTRGTTESINMVARGWGDRHVGAGDEIVLSPLEHHSNMVPWQQLSQRRVATLRYFPLTQEGTIPRNAVEETIGARTRIVAITAMSNVTGYIPPLREIIARAHEVGAVVLLDGAQYVSHHPIDVTDLGCDFLAFSGHKMCGPTGIGALYGRTEHLEEMDPSLYGGDMIDQVTLDGASWARVPERFEAGTPNIAGAIGIGRAARFLADVGMQAIVEHERRLSAHMRRRMEELPYITTYGAAGAEEKGGIFSFGIDGVHPHDVGSLLDQQGIAVRTGFHCAQPLMQHFGILGTVRASFYLYNTTVEIDRFVEAVDRLYEILG